MHIFCGAVAGYITLAPLGPRATPTMNQRLDTSGDHDEKLLGDFRRLWSDADQLWDQRQNAAAFHGYVSADYMAVYRSLAELRGRVLTFLEWGSGLGIVTIMASQMGFEAYGIEAEPELVDLSNGFAQAHGSDARFAEGSFVPDDFVWDPADGSDVNRTIIDVPAAYDELDMELRDFDLVYAYPWPDEHTLFRNIVRQFGRQDTLFLSYDAREGTELIRFDDPRRRL